jgi:2-oxoglutarate ferredoxin oxidoreductase subunit delta
MTEEETEKTEADEARQAKDGRKMPKGRVIVFGKWCKECGLCVAFCPRGVLGRAKDGGTIVVNPDECTACRWCELHCPDFAITVKRVNG